MFRFEPRFPRKSSLTLTVHPAQSSDHTQMLNAGLFERVTRHTIAEPLVERNGADLGIAPDTLETARESRFVAGLHQRAAHTRAAVVGEHCQTADLAALPEIDARRPDGPITRECQEMHRVLVAIVHLERRRHGLLIDEDVEPDGANRCLVSAKVNLSNPNSHQSSRLCRRPRAPKLPRPQSAQT